MSERIASWDREKAHFYGNELEFLKNVLNPTCLLQSFKVPWHSLATGICVVEGGNPTSFHGARAPGTPRPRAKAALEVLTPCPRVTGARAPLSILNFNHFQVSAYWRIARRLVLSEGSSQGFRWIANVFFLQLGDGSGMSIIIHNVATLHISEKQIPSLKENRML